MSKVLILGFTIIFALSGCVASSDVGESPSTSESSGSDNDVDAAESASSVGNGPWSVGETYVAEDYSMTVNSVRTTEGGSYSEPDYAFVIVLDMTIENTSSDSHSVSSLFGFELQGSDDYKYDQSYFAETKGALDGDIAANSKVRGEIAFDVPDLDFYTLLYTHDIFGDAVPFLIVAADLNNGAAEGSNEEPESAASFGVGDMATGDDFTVTLNSARSSRDDSFGGPDNDFYLVVDLTIENTSTEESSVSSLASFEIKGSDLYKYDVGYFADVKGSLDGSILGGSKLRGEIAFDVPTLPFYEFSYTHDFFGETVTFLITESDLG
jgi:hypothetical protein